VVRRDIVSMTSNRNGDDRFRRRAIDAAVMRCMMACILLLGCLISAAEHAQFGVPWRHAPRIAVVSTAGDPRVRAVDEAVLLIE
jgi:hypothetical protein